MPARKPARCRRYKDQIVSLLGLFLLFLLLFLLLRSLRLGLLFRRRRCRLRGCRRRSVLRWTLGRRRCLPRRGLSHRRSIIPCWWRSRMSRLRTIFRWSRRGLVRLCRRWPIRLRTIRSCFRPVGWRGRRSVGRPVADSVRDDSDLLPAGWQVESVRVCSVVPPVADSSLDDSELSPAGWQGESARVWSVVPPGGDSALADSELVPAGW